MEGIIINNLKIYNSDIKKENKKNILKNIFLKKNITRKDISSLSNISLSSVTRLINELSQEKYIQLNKKISKNRYGRKSEIFSVNENRINVFVVDIDIKNTLFGLGNFKGEVKILKTIKTPETFEKTLEHIKLYTNLFNVNYDYISFSIPGIVNSKENIILNAPNLNWHNININNFEEKEKYIIENDSNLSILAEKVFSNKLKNINNAIYVLIKDGVGGGLLINNNVYKGNFFSAGEIGHNRFIINKKLIEFEHIDQEKNKDIFIDRLALNISYAVNLLNLEAVIIGGNFINFETDVFKLLKEKIYDNIFENCKNVIVQLTDFNYVPASLTGACYNAILRHINNI